MRSIRLSLIVYFLFLLAAALGAVSWFVYQTTLHTLQANEASNRKHLERQYESDCKQTRHDFDRKLLARAWEIERHARGTFNNYEPFLPLIGALGAGGQPAAQLGVPLWLVAGQPPDPKVSDLAAREQFSDVYYPVHIHIDIGTLSPSSASGVDEDAGPMPDGQSLEIFQTYTAHGRPLQASRALEELRGDNPSLDTSFTLSADAPRKAELLRNRPFRPPGTEARELEERERAIYDDVELRPGVKVRRVTWIAAVWGTRVKFGLVPPRSYWLRFQKKSNPPAAVKGGPSAAAKGGKGPPLPGLGGRVFIIQCASETNTRERDARLASIQATLQENLAKQEAETLDTMARLRTLVLWIFAATFVAVVVGGFWLVRLGLSPLGRLSEAVSRVSEKDFRLQVDGRIPGELKPIVTRLAETLDQLKRAFAREKQAAADISHELRTPLAALLTTLEVGLRKRRTPEEYAEILEDCHTSGKQMTQLVERLLALARLDAGVDHLRVREVDVANLVSQCADLVRPLAAVRGLAVRLHADGQTSLQADPDKLREVLTNLLHNAIEYNKPNGSIDVAVARDNGHVRVEVRDTGIGIAPEAREHIFERFYRADPSRHADTLHAGIGLAIVKGYVDLMGGSIGVDSGPAGSTFRIDFPVR